MVGAPDVFGPKATIEAAHDLERLSLDYVETYGQPVKTVLESLHIGRAPARAQVPKRTPT